MHARGRKREEGKNRATNRGRQLGIIQVRGDKETKRNGEETRKQSGSACGDIHHVTGTKVWKYPDQTRPEPTVEGRKSVVGILQKRAVNRAKAELVGQYEEFTHAHTKRKNRWMNEGR